MKLQGVRRQANAREADAAPSLDIVAVLLTAAGVVLIMFVVPALRTPPHVASLTIENPHPYLLEVSASDGAGVVVGLGPVDYETTTTRQDILDLGDRWIFAFRYAGVDAGALHTTRAELDSSGWRITVPDEVGRTLREKGFSPRHRPKQDAGG